MGFKEIASLDAENAIAIGKMNKKTNKAYPKSAEGFYLGSRVVENKRGTSRLHFLQTEAGNLGVWGTTDLDRKLGAVPAGTMVRITSTGTKATPNGDMYTYRVEQDSDRTVEVSFSEAVETSDASDDSTTEEPDDAGYNSDDVDQEEVAQASALAAAERKAKVEALLKSKSRTK